jgi:hypothetical protein
MANIKFSAFTQKVAQADVDFLVGYTGTDNVRIAPSTLGDGIYLPLAGGTMTGNLKLNDGIVLQIGSSADLQLFHELSNSYISNNIGDLTIRNLANDKDIVFKCDDGAGGTETYFFLDGSQATATTVYTKFPDNSIISLGDGSDCYIRHDGTNTRIDNSMGDLIIRNYADDKDIHFSCDDGSGGTALYYYLDGSRVINRFPKNVYLEDNVKLLFGDVGTPDLEIYHDGTDSYIAEVGTGDLIISGGNDIIFKDAVGNLLANMNQSDSVELYFGGSKKFETTSGGIEVTDEVSIGTSLVHTGDTDTKVSFGTDEIVLTTAGTDRVTVKPDGKVGIGISTGLAKELEVEGNIRARTSGGATAAAIDITSGGTWRFRSNPTSGTNNYGLDIIKGSAGTDIKMSIDTNGKVGIGTNAPAALLEIAGSGDALRIESTNTGSAGAQIDLLHFTTSPADNDIHGLINFGGYYTGTTSAYGTQIKSVWSDVSARDAELQFFTNNSGTLYQALTIKSSGVNKINSSGSGNHEANYKTGTYYKLSTGSTTAMTMVKVGHTHAINYTVIAKVDTSNVGTLVGNTATAYGTNGGIIVDSEAYSGVVTDIAVTYDNSYYGLNVAVTYTGATAPHIWMAVKGQSSEDFVAQ